MKKLIHKLSVMIAVIFLLAQGLQVMQYFDAKELLESEVEKRAEVTNALMREKVASWLDLNQQVIRDAGNFILENSENKALIEDYLSLQLGNHPIFASLYFGTADNVLINGSERVSPAGFKTDERPWYKKAASSKRMIMTDPFLNASHNAWVVSIASPVFNTDGSLMGVVSGDIMLATIDNQIQWELFTPGGMTVFVRENGEIITRKRTEDLNDTLLLMRSEYKKSVANDPGREGLTKTVVFGERSGFFSYQRIETADIAVLNFTPIEAYGVSDERLIATSVSLIILMVAGYGIFINVQRRHIIAPLIELEKNIEMIDIAQDLSYRISSIPGTDFKSLVCKINGLLSEIQQNIQEIRNDKEELHSINEELEASLEQLIATEQEVVFQKRNFEALFRNEVNGIVLLDSAQIVIESNQSFGRMFGYTSEEVRGRSITELAMETGNVDEKQSGDPATYLTGEEFEMVCIGGDGRQCIVSVKGVPLLSESWDAGGYLIYSDISARKEHQSQLEYISTHDNLTGLFNREYFNRQIEVYGETLSPITSVIIADLNGLKLTNDAFGQTMGDELLRITADIIVSECGASDIVARTGGGEFSVILPGTAMKGAESISKRIVKRVNSAAIGNLQISVSLGWAQTSGPHVTIQDALKSAADFMCQRKLTEGPSVRGKTIHAIVKTLHEKNEREAMHSHRVSDLCQRLGQTLQLSEREQIELVAMGLLHDVGKIAIDDKILNKPGLLTQEEYGEMKRHPEIGYRILSSVNEMAEIASGVLAHHERWDGKGYPLGLKGSEIPYLARVISVVDSFDAMTSSRTYSRALSEKDALEELQKCAGTQFSPEIVAAFIDTLTFGGGMNQQICSDIR